MHDVGVEDRVFVVTGQRARSFTLSPAPLTLDPSFISSAAVMLDTSG